MIRAGSLFLALSLLAIQPAQAGDDPSIQGARRKGIQTAMQDFIYRQTVGGKLLHYDPVDGELLQLRLEALHDGIVKKGDFYVSCADFVGEGGRKFDLDFLVVPAGESFRVNQAIVHAVDGKKRKYQLESRWPSLF